MPEEACAQHERSVRCEVSAIAEGAEPHYPVVAASVPAILACVVFKYWDWERLGFARVYMLPVPHPHFPELARAL